jgi:hypothetical protein
MTDIPPQIELLSEACIANDVQRYKLGNVAVLQKMADRIAGEELKYPASAVLIVTLGPDGPNVTWHGITATDQFLDVEMAVQAVRSAYMFGNGGEPIDPSEVARKDAERRVAGKAATEAYRARKRAEIPWRCEHCDEGFRTERGAKMHESKSEKRGCPRCKRPRCVLRGFGRDQDGNVISCQRCSFTGEPRYAKPSEAIALEERVGLRAIEGNGL